MSGSTDNGADPNEIVMINDVLGDTSLPSEAFSVIDGSMAGLRYGGVAYAAATPELSTWATLLVGFGGLGFAAFRRGAQLTSLAQGSLRVCLASAVSANTRLRGDATFSSSTVGGIRG